VSRVARAVHDLSLAVGIVLSILLSGCVIPPSLSVENQDAGVNSPPSVVAVRSDQEAYSEPGPITLTIADDNSLNVSLLDTDVGDTLYVRMFVSYTVESPTAPRSLCTANPVESTRRSVSCNVKAVCLPADKDKDQLPMTVVVFDREPLESGDPPFQAMPEGGLSTSRFFFLKCIAE
jgi:hypothetical protein